MKEFINDLLKLKVLMSQKDKVNFVIMLFLVIITSILEAVGIGIIPLFVTTLMSPSTLSENQWIGHWFVNIPDLPSEQIAIWASAIMVVFIIIKGAIQMLVYYSQAKIVNGYRVKLSNRMFRAYQSASYEWHLQRSSSELLRNIQNDTNQILVGVIGPILDVVMGVVMGVFIIAIMMYSIPESTVISLVMMGITLFVVIRAFQRQLLDIGKVMRRETKGMILAIQQGFGALVDSRILGCGQYLANVFNTSIVSQSKVLTRRAVIEKATTLLVENILFIGLIIILLVLIMVESSLENALPVLSMLGIATIRLKQTISIVAGSINKIQSSRAFIPGIVNDINEIEAIEKVNQERKCLLHPILKFNKLELKNVNYSYPDVDVPVIDEISLTLNQGECIAFIGPTGCGKSTLVNLILGLLEPKSGKIIVNGKDIFTDIDGWRAKLGYIPQSIFLIDDSIKANVAFGVYDKDINEEQLTNSLREAHLDNFINTLPDGIDTIIGERGVRLSGGQRQRLGIARALYFNPEVLILDEATSALDGTTEAKVMNAIQDLKKSKTFIIIAHRLNTIKDCDRTYSLQDGKIKETNSFEDLSKKA